MQSLYQILIKTPTGDKVGDVSDMPLAFKYILRRNRPSLITLDFDMDDLRRVLKVMNITARDLFATNVNEVYVYRNGVAVVAGQIMYRNVDMDEDKKAQLQAPGWLELFNQRVTSISQVYSPTDIGQIMWDLIDQSQLQTNGDFGITQGTIQASRLAERNTYSYKNIKDAIIQLSEVIGGPDFEFTPDKVFNVYSPKQGRLITDFSFTYPGNIRSIGYEIDGSKMSNQVIFRGAGTGEQGIISVQSDTTAQGTYKLRQSVYQRPDVSVQESLDDLAEEQLRVSSGLFTVPRIKVLGVEPPFGSYWLGDEVNIAVTEDVELFGDANGVFRIEEIEVSVDANNVEDVSIKLSR